MPFFAPFLALCPLPFLLFFASPGSWAYVVKPFSNGELADEVAKAFLATPDCFKFNIFGLGSGRGDLKYQIDVDKVRTLKCKFRMPMPIGGGLEKLLVAKKIPTAKDNNGAQGLERAVENDKLVKLLEATGTEQLIVRDKTLRGKIDVRKAAEDKKQPPKKDEGPKWQRPKKAEPEKKGPTPAAATPANRGAQSSSPPRWRTRGADTDEEDSRPRRSRSTARTVKRVTFASDTEDEAESPRPAWRRGGTRPAWRRPSTSPDRSSTSPSWRRRRTETTRTVRERTVTVEESEAESEEESPRRGRPSWRRGISRSPSRGIRRISLSPSSSGRHRWVKNPRSGTWNKVIYDDDSAPQEREGRTAKWKTAGKTPERNVKEDPDKEVIPVKLNLVETGAVLEKFTGYFAKLIGKKGKEKAENMCSVLREFDPKHQQLKGMVTDVSFVAEAFKEYKTALDELDLYQEEQIRTSPKTATCAYDLALIFVAAEFGKQLMDRIRKERMGTAAELKKSKQEMVRQILAGYDTLEGEMRKAKPNETARERGMRQDAQEEIQKQREVVKQHKEDPKSEVVGDSMGQVMHQLRRVANHKDSPQQNTLKGLHTYWHGLSDEGPHWLIKKSVSGLEKCGAGEDGLKKCLSGAGDKLMELMEDIDDWFNIQKPVKPEDWKWLNGIQFELRWTDVDKK